MRARRADVGIAVIVAVVLLLSVALLVGMVSARWSSPLRVPVAEAQGTGANITDFSGLATPLGAPNFGVPSVIKTSMGTVVTTGVTTNIAIVPAGQTWLIHGVVANIKTNYDCTGDDCTLDVGDAADADGFLDLADAEMQAADTEGTGFAAGWEGMGASTLGAYMQTTNINLDIFVEAASTTPVTITAVASETTSDTMSAGAADIYVWYTRIK